MNMNTFYEVVPERGVVQVQAPQDGLQPTAIKCCAACHDLGDACTAFQWCVVPAGGRSAGCSLAAYRLLVLLLLLVLVLAAAADAVAQPSHAPAPAAAAGAARRAAARCLATPRRPSPTRAASCLTCGASWPPA